jgi:EAL domain-containing protein (putative c-di-GMP-specific phosphodiesterase class I)
MSALLERVLDPKQLQTHYQPVVRCGTGNYPFAFVECLIRGPKGTNLEIPDVLFEYARRKHVEATLDMLALRCFLSEMSWLCGLQFSVNFHASTLSRDRVISSRIIGELQEAGIVPQRLYIEVIETVPELNLDHLLYNLSRLKEAGCTILLDDFGAGYSNLHLLRHIRPDIVKIDRGLMPYDFRDHHSITCLSAAVKCGQAMASRVLVEGVETRQQLQLAEDLEVDYAQGFYFSKPLSLGEVQDWLWSFTDESNQAAQPLSVA